MDPGRERSGSGIVVPLIRSACPDARERFLAVAAATLWLAALPGCAEPCCTVDSRPVPLERAPGGALVARASNDATRAAPFPMLLDTGSPLTCFAGAPGVSAQVELRSFRILDATATGDDPPVRGIFRGIDALTAPLGAIGRDADVLAPQAVLGTELLLGYSVELRPAAPAITFWTRSPASDGFLSTAGYAVLHFELRGGGEIETLDRPDFLGVRGPRVFPPTRVVLRACAAPASFQPDAPRQSCPRGDERTLATGADLALVLATGTGPLVLGRSAWERVKRRLAVPPAEIPGELVSPHASTKDSPDGRIAASFVTLPRLALVNLEAGPDADPGPCVELGRARRLEQVSWAQVNDRAPTPCAEPEPCDTDPRDASKAQNSAAYLDIGGSLEVAVLPDTSPLLQALRLEIRPKGPEVDGLLGVAALGRARVEIDYLSRPSRAIFACEPETPRDACWAASRCPRLSDNEHAHACFGLPPHGLEMLCCKGPKCG